MQDAALLPLSCTTTTTLQMITSLLVSGKATRIETGGTLRLTIKWRSLNGRMWGNSKLVGIREFTPASLNFVCWISSCDRVEIQVASITSFLPSLDKNKEEYLGTARGPVIPSLLTPLQESEFRRKQAEAQIRDAETRTVVFDADPSPDAEITSEAIDPEVPLGIMDEDGNIVANPTDVEISNQKAFTQERIIDAGLFEKCATDVRELVSSFFRSQVIVATFV
jgi:hypothetical protein